MKRLLIFDLDGTLVDSAPDIVAVANRIRARRGMGQLGVEAVTSAIGYGIRRLILSLFEESHADPALLKELETEFYQLYEENLTAHTRPYEGVEDFLSTWDGPFAIATNKNERLAKRLLGELKLDRFPWVTVLGGNTLSKSKPDPAQIFEAMRVAGTAADETVMIGDGMADLNAARNAGVEFIGVSFGYSKPADLRAAGAARILESYRDLPKMIRGF